MVTKAETVLTHLNHYVDGGTPNTAEIESWPPIFFSERERVVFTGEREASFSEGSSWKYLLFVLKESLKNPGKPILSAEIKQHLNLGIPEDLQMTSLGAPMLSARKKVEKDWKNPTILVTEGVGPYSTVTLRARVIRTDVQEDYQEEAQSKEPLIPYLPPGEIQIPDYFKKDEELKKRYIERATGFADTLDTAVAKNILSKFAQGIQGRKAATDRSAWNILKSLAPYIEIYYSGGNAYKTEELLELITGYWEDSKEYGMRVVYAVDKIVKENWDETSAPNYLWGSEKIAIFESCNILKSRGVIPGQVVLATAAFFGIERPVEYTFVIPHPKIFLHDKESVPTETWGQS